MAVTGIPRNLQVLNPRGQHEFLIPSKKIHNEDDVQFWLKSEAYTDIMTFVLQLNFSMFPQTNSSEGQQAVNTVDLETIAQRSRLSPPILSLQELVGKLAAMVEEAPPDAGPQRFGNSSFRKWHQLVESRLPELLDKHVPANVLAFNNPESAEVSPKAEIASYFLGSFGSAQRLDYGTGHELSFLAFIACIWKLGGFPSGVVGVVEREIVAGVIEP
jgi:serine/threonine-protein phosphatase 2A activator